MGQTMQSWKDRSRSLLGDVSIDLLPEDDLESAVRQAIRRHSRLFPRVTHTDYPGNGSSYDLLVSSLTSWVNGFSIIDAIELPQGERQPVYLDEQSYRLMPNESNPTTIRLLVDTPQTGEMARVFYTALWPTPTSTASVDLVPDSDFDTVCLLVAYFGAGELESRAAAHTRPTLPAATTAGVEGESERWRIRKEGLLNEYFEALGIDRDSVVPADGIIDWDAISSFREYGYRFLFRGRR